MSRRDRALHRHARVILEHELMRARKRLAELPEGRRAALEVASARVVAAVVDSVLEESQREPVLARALDSIYAPEPPSEPKVLSLAAD